MPGKSPDETSLYCAANVPQVVVTIAENPSAPFGVTVPLPGATATASTRSAATVTTASEVRAGSATLVATTWYVPAVDGAVYMPAVVMVPPEGPSLTDQLTPWFAEPVTVEEKATVPHASTVEVAGPTETETTGATGATTVTVATWTFEASAWLAAAT
jgi:hypothetical protein